MQPIFGQRVMYGLDDGSCIVRRCVADVVATVDDDATLTDGAAVLHVSAQGYDPMYVRAAYSASLAAGCWTPLP